MRSEPLSNKQTGTPPPSKRYGDRLIIVVPEYPSALESEDEPLNAQGTLDHNHFAITPQRSHHPPDRYSHGLPNRRMQHRVPDEL